MKKVSKTAAKFRATFPGRKNRMTFHATIQAIKIRVFCLFQVAADTTFCGAINIFMLHQTNCGTLV